MRLTIIVVITFLSLHAMGQLPLRYTFKKVEGVIYEKSGNAVQVSFKSRRKLNISNCTEQELDTFLRALALARHGRNSLEFLLTTSARVTISISDKIGILLRDGKYTLIGGASGPQGRSIALIPNEASINLWIRLFNKHKYIYVYNENVIEIFKGSITYANDMSRKLSEENIKLLDWESNKEITKFSLDTIKLEPIAYPDMLYKNFTELFYFAGLHEIFHLRPENIKLQEMSADAESPAMLYETKAFKKRAAVNRRKIKYP